MYRIPDKYHAQIIVDIIIDSNRASLPLDISENMYKLVIEAIEETSNSFDGRIQHLRATVSLKKTENGDIDGN